MKRLHHPLFFLCAWATVSCTSLSSLNDDVHSSVDSWIDKSSDYAGVLEKKLSHTLQRWETSSEVTLTALRDDADIIIEQWVDEGRFGIALATIDRISPTHQKYALLQERRPAIAAQATHYEAEIIRQAQQHVARQQWDQALTLYESALAQLPASEALRAGAQAVHDEQSVHIARLKQQLLVSDGHKLLESIRLQQDALSANSRDKLARQKLDKQRSKAKQVAQDLYTHGLQAIDNNQLEEAREILVLASQLDSHLDTEQAFDTLSERQAQAAHQQGLSLLRQGKLIKARRALTRAQQLHDSPKTRAAMTELRRAENKHEQKIRNNLNEQYEQALKAGDLLQAKTLLVRMEKISPDKSQFKQQQDELDQRINSSIQHHFSQGMKHYSHDRFEQAITHWRKVIELDPQHEQARQRLERAQRIVNKLKELRQRQQP